MPRASARQRQQSKPAAWHPENSRGGIWQPCLRKLQPGSGAPWSLLLFLLALWVSACKGAPMASHVLQGEQILQLWNEIDDVCSTYLTRDTPSQSSNVLEDLCFMVLELLQKAQEIDEKDNTKRSSVLHPLLQLIPQLHERRLKRNKVDGLPTRRIYFLYSGTLAHKHLGSRTDRVTNKNY
ncbi:Neuromedin-U [Varanus komodoensis]|nr:Neuromedin-U [Varanus komodoensis]